MKEFTGKEGLVMRSSYFRKWYLTRANAMAIENCRGYWKWLVKNLYGNRMSFDRAHLLMRDNRKTFRKIFGAPDAYWKGSEFRFSVWVQGFQGEKFILLTAKGKGTCIEICDTTPDSIYCKSLVIKGYVENLIKTIERQTHNEIQSSTPARQ